MSRIGVKPVVIPKNIKVTIGKDSVDVEGPKGKLQISLLPTIKVEIIDNLIKVNRTHDTKQIRALHGLIRAMIANMIKGVSEGYQKVLEITGVGYKAQVQNKKVVFSLGYSHPVEFVLPEGISAEVDPKQVQITLKGIDKQLIGQVAANLRGLRLPDIYKGKGVRYSGEVIKLKAGKAGKK